MRKSFRERTKEKAVLAAFTAARKAAGPIYKKLIYWRNTAILAILTVIVMALILIWRLK